MVFRMPHFGTGAALAVLLACLSAGPVLAADASIKQVYDEAKSGNIDGALALMAPVLKDHPNSAKAHYVEAELLAKDNRLDDARTELAKAKSLAPGLPGISNHSVQELEAKLNGTPAYASVGHAAPVVVEHRAGIPWGLIIIVGLVIFGVLALLRRRAAPDYGPGYGGGSGYGGVAPGPGYGGPGYGAPGYGAPGYGGGMGGGIMGGLAQGAAMGAGFAVGEEVVDHLMGGERGGSGERYASGGYTDSQQRVDPDADMGGNDFGISDGGSWDDSSSGGGDDSW